MLGAVQRERPPAEEPGEEDRRQHETDCQPDCLRQKDESERKDESSAEDRAVTVARNSGLSKERREGGGEPREPADERNPPPTAVGARHPALAQGAVAPSECPVSLAHDHDAVRPGHASQARKRQGLRQRQRGTERGSPPLHSAERPPGPEGPNGLFRSFAGPSSGRGRKSREPVGRERRSERSRECSCVLLSLG